MTNKFDDELYIPDEEMKVPGSTRTVDPDGNTYRSRLVIILSAAIVITLLVLAGLVVYDRFIRTDSVATAPPAPSRPTAEQNQEPESNTARAEVDTMQALSPSDQLSSIITDLENTRLDTLDAEINAIEDEMQ